MATIAELMVNIGANISDFQSSMKKMEKDLSAMGGKMQSVGGAMAASFGAAGVAVAAGLGAAVKTAADFEQVVVTAGAKANASAKDIGNMRQAALDLGASTSKSASEVATGMDLMAAAGFDANQIIGAMPGVISAAEASGEDMALVAGVMSDALNSFHLEASKATDVSDVLAKTANMSAAGIQDMSYTFKYAAPVAYTLGVALEDLGAATGVMANAGIRGEQAGTTLRSMMLSLTSPTKEAAKGMAALGLNVFDSSGKMKPFNEVVGQLRTGMEGMNAQQKAAYTEMIFGKEAISGVLALVEAGPEKIKTFSDELYNSAGASAEAAAVMRDTLKGSWDQMTGAFETAAISIGTALTPAIRAMADGLQSVANWFNELSPGMQSFIATSAAVTAAVLLGVGALGALVAGAGLVVSGLGAMGLTLAGVASFILPVTAALAGLVAVGWLVYENWDTIKAVSIEVWGAISDFIEPIVEEISSFIQEQFGDLAAWWKVTWPEMQKAFTNIWNAIVTFITPVLNAIKKAFDATFPYIKTMLSGVWDGIKMVISGSLNVIMGAVNVFVALFTGNWSKLWASIQQILTGAWGMLRGIFTTQIALVNGLISTFVVGIGTYFSTLASNMVEYGKNIVQGLWNGIESLGDWVRGKVTDFVESIGSTIKEFFGIASPSKLTTEYGGYVAEGLAVGIEEKTPMVVAKAKAMADAVVAEAQRALSVMDGIIYENINGNWVEGGKVGGRVGAGDPIYGGGGSWSDMPDWLKPSKGNDGGKKDTRPRDDDAFVDNEGSYEKPNDFFDPDQDGRYGYSGLAEGGRVTGSGMTWVGEEGPELLNLPKGSTVTPLDKMPSSTNQTVFNFNVNASDIDDVVKLINTFKRLPQVARQLGLNN